MHEDAPEGVATAVENLFVQYALNARLKPPAFNMYMYTNNKLYNIGSKIGAYTVSRIDEKSVILSGNRRSIILELEIDEDQTVYSLEGFKKAFSNARKNNQPTFMYKGKLYSTQIEN